MTTPRSDREQHASERGERLRECGPAGAKAVARPGRNPEPRDEERERRSEHERGDEARDEVLQVGRHAEAEVLSRGVERLDDQPEHVEERGERETTLLGPDEGHDRPRKRGHGIER